MKILKDKLALKWSYMKAIKNMYFNRNRLYFTFGVTRGVPLRDIHLELANICNLSCAMCFLKDMKRKKKIMEFELIKKICNETRRLNSIGLNNWGEPLLHPDLVPILRFLKDKNRDINVIFATNGTLLTHDMIIELFSSGLDHLQFSLEGIKKTYETIRGVPYNSLKQIIESALAVRNGDRYNTAISICVTVFQENEDDIKNIEEQWGNKVDKIYYQPKLELALASSRTNKCYELWKGHLVVLSSGDVVPCCVDYEGILKLGNAYKEPLYKIYNSEKMINLRKLHLEGDLPSFCKKCSEYNSPNIPKRFN